jgi:hypothetical protein
MSGEQVQQLANRFNFLPIVVFCTRDNSKLTAPIKLESQSYPHFQQSIHNPFAAYWKSCARRMTTGSSEQT